MASPSRTLWQGEQLQRIIETAADGIHIFDRGGTFVLSNAAIERMYGLPRSAWEGRHYTVPPICRVTLDGRPFPIDEHPFVQVMRTGEPVYGVEFVVVRPDGQQVFVSMNAAPLRDPDGTFAGAVATVTDITARVRAEQALEQALQREQAAHRAAEETLEQLNALVGGLSHDLRNPLTAIKGRIQLLERRARQLADGAGFSEGLAELDAYVNRMLAQLNEVVDLTRLQAGEELDLIIRDFDLVELAARCVEEFQRQSDRHRLELVVTMPELVGPWDAARLERVVTNLLSNAIKYSPAGGTVTVAISLDDAPDGGHPRARLEVRDQGIGIPAGDLPRVFDRFHRGANARGIAGAGLGLASVRRIVEQHGGSVAVESEEGRGTTVSVRLPIRPADR